MSIDAKIAEIMEESKLLGLVEEEQLDEKAAEVNKNNFQGDKVANSKTYNKDNYKNAEAITDNSETDEAPSSKKAEKELKIRKESLDAYSVEELEDFMMSEDFEQLDELSKKTLGSYIMKAQNHRTRIAATNQDIEHHNNNLNRASHGASKELASSLNKAKDDLDTDRRKNFRTDNKRFTGISRAVGKLTKESLDVTADVDALMFGESLSEEFKQKATTIFEAAVVSRVKEEVAVLEEEFEERLAEQVDSITEGLVEKIDGYLDYVVEQWIEQNEIALESGIKSDIMESFITGMKGLFEEHYIDVPEEKYDVLGEMESKIDALEEKLNEQVERNIDLKKSLSEATRRDIVKTISEGLTDTETEKFLALTEELNYDSADSFQSKVLTIRENYFNGNKTTRSLVESFVTDSPVEELNEGTQYQTIDPTVAAYVKAIKQFNK